MTHAAGGSGEDDDWMLRYEALDPGFGGII